MTNPKSMIAEDVAVRLIGSISTLVPRNEWKRIKSLIEIALADYAEHRVREEEETAYKAGCNEAVLRFFDEKKKVYDEGYRAGIEAAAKVAYDDGLKVSHCSHVRVVSEKIRALPVDMEEK